MTVARDTEPAYLVWHRESTVSGGWSSIPQQFGWQITNAAGFTMAVARDSDFAQRLNDLEEMVAVLRKRNALYLLRRAADEGYTSFSEEERELLTRLLTLEGTP